MIAKLYKLTDSRGQTRGNTQWGEGIAHVAQGDAGQDLCSDGWIHAYESPLLAVLLNLIHANFADPQLWKAEGEIGKRDGQLKVGCRRLKTLNRIDLPQVTTNQRVAFGILCAKEVCRDTSWNRWADDWLSGKDRSAGAEAWAWARRAAAAEAAAWASLSCSDCFMAHHMRKFSPR